MASTSAVSMALPLTQNRLSASEVLFKPLSVKPLRAIATTRSNGRLQVKVVSSLKEKAVTGLTAAAAITASLVIPEVAQAAEGLTPSLNNFLFSILSGGFVLTAIIVAVIGVSNFDPVNRT